MKCVIIQHSVNQNYYIQSVTCYNIFFRKDDIMNKTSDMRSRLEIEVMNNNVKLFNDLIKLLEDIIQRYTELLQLNLEMQEDNQSATKTTTGNSLLRKDNLGSQLELFKNNFYTGLKTKLSELFDFNVAANLINVCLDKKNESLFANDILYIFQNIKNELLSFCRQQFYTVLSFKVDYLIILIRNELQTLNSQADQKNKSDPLLKQDIEKFLLELQQTIKKSISTPKQSFNFNSLVTVINYCNKRNLSATIKNLILEINQIIINDLKTTEIKQGANFIYHSINAETASQVIKDLCDNDHKIPAGEMIWRVCLGLSDYDIDKFIANNRELIVKFRSLDSYQQHCPFNNNYQELGVYVISKPKLLLFLTAHHLIKIIESLTPARVQFLSESLYCTISDDLVDLYNKSVFNADLNLLNYATIEQPKKAPDTPPSPLKNLISSLLTSPQKPTKEPTLTPKDKLKNKLVFLRFLTKNGECTRPLINEVAPTGQFILSHGVHLELLPLLEPIRVIDLFQQAEHLAHFVKSHANNPKDFMQFRNSIEYQWLMVRIIEDIKTADINYFTQLKKIPFILYELLRMTEFYSIPLEIIAKFFQALGPEIIIETLQFLDAQNNKHETVEINNAIFKTFSIASEKYVIRKDGTHALFLKLTGLLLHHSLTELRKLWLKQPEVMQLTHQYLFLLKTADDTAFNQTINEQLIQLTSQYLRHPLFEQGQQPLYDEGLLNRWIVDAQIQSQLKEYPSLLNRFDLNVINICAKNSLFLKQIMRQNILTQFILDNLTLLINSDKDAILLTNTIKSLYRTSQVDSLVQLIQRILPTFNGSPYSQNELFGACEADNLKIDPTIAVVTLISEKYPHLIKLLKLSQYTVPLIAATLDQQHSLIHTADLRALEIELTQASLSQSPLLTITPPRSRQNKNTEQALANAIAFLDTSSELQYSQVNFKQLDKEQRAQIEQLKQETQQKTDENQREIKELEEQNQKLDEQAKQLQQTAKEFATKKQQIEEEQKQREKTLQQLDDQITKQLEEEQQRKKQLEEKRIQAAAEFDRKQKELQQKLEEERQERETQLAILLSNHQQEMKKRELQLKREEEESARQQNEEQLRLDQLLQKHLQEITSLRNHHQEAIEKIASEGDRETQQLIERKNTLSAKNKQDIESLENQIIRLQEENQKQRQRKQAELERKRKESESLKQKYAEEEIKRKEEEVERLRRAKELAFKQKAEEDLRQKKEAEEEQKRQEQESQRTAQELAKKRKAQEEVDRQKKALENHYINIGKNNELIKKIEEARKQHAAQKELLTQRQQELEKDEREVEERKRKLDEDERKIELRMKETEIRSTENDLKRQQLDALEEEQKEVAQSLEDLERNLASFAKEQQELRSDLESTIQLKKDATERMKQQYQEETEQLKQQQQELQQTIAQTEKQQKDLLAQRQQIEQQEQLRQISLLQEEQERHKKQIAEQETQRKKQEQYDKWLAENDRKKREIEDALREQNQVQEQIIASENELAKIKTEREEQLKSIEQEKIQTKRVAEERRLKLAEDEQRHQTEQALYIQKMEETKRLQRELDQSATLIDQRSKNILSTKQRLDAQEKQIQLDEQATTQQEKELARKKDELQSRRKKLIEDGQSYEQEEQKFKKVQELLLEKQKQLKDQISKAAETNKKLDEDIKQSKANEQQLLIENARKKEEEQKKQAEELRRNAQEEERKRQSEELQRRVQEQERKKQSEEQAVIADRLRKLEEERAAQDQVDKNLRDRGKQLQPTDPKVLQIKQITDDGIKTAEQLLQTAKSPRSDAQGMAALGIHKTASPRSGSSASANGLNEEQIGSPREGYNQGDDINGVRKKKSNRDVIQLSNAGFLDTMAEDERRKKEEEQKAELEKKKNETPRQNRAAKK